jgi:hypothetical protein
LALVSGFGVSLACGAGEEVVKQIGKPMAAGSAYHLDA